MRSSLIAFVIAVLETSVLAGGEKFVIHLQDIVSVCADDAEVELVTSVVPRSTDTGLRDITSFEFSFVFGPSAAVVEGMYISRMSLSPDGLTIRLKRKDAKTAAELAAYLESKRPKTPIRRLVPKTEPNEYEYFHMAISTFDSEVQAGARSRGWL
jgi:hypothetical protein